MSICPSYDPARPDAQAIGLGGADAARRTLSLVVIGGAGDRAHRAIGPCQEGGCANWQDARCRVGERLVETAPTALPQDRWRVSDCAIRADCRWFAQSGPAACNACAYVIEPRFYA